LALRLAILTGPRERPGLPPRRLPIGAEGERELALERVARALPFRYSLAGLPASTCR